MQRILVNGLMATQRSNDFTWFRNLFGFEEPTRSRSVLAEIQSKFTLSAAGDQLTCLENGRTLQAGSFSTPTLRELRESALAVLKASSMSIGLQVEHIVTNDILAEHHRHPHATFQAASQFNCLEFPSYHVNPEDGITAYSTDRTQGPACAIACPAGTLYRNYFAQVYDTKTGSYAAGQTAGRQINNLDALEEALDNASPSKQYWTVRNGYTFSTEEALAKLNAVLAARDGGQLRDLVKVGLQRDTEVVYRSRFEEVAADPPLLVTQVYCSALSCAYSGVQLQHWEALARIILQANYEACLWAAVLNMLHHQDQPLESNKLYLTFIGGGVFGNDMGWIGDSIANAVQRVSLQIQEAEGPAAQGHREAAALLVNICYMRGLDQRRVQEINDQLPDSLKVRGGAQAEL